MYDAVYSVISSGLTGRFLILLKAYHSRVAVLVTNQVHALPNNSNWSLTSFIITTRPKSHITRMHGHYAIMESITYKSRSKYISWESRTRSERRFTMSLEQGKTNIWLGTDRSDWKGNLTSTKTAFPWQLSSNGLSFVSIWPYISVITQLGDFNNIFWK